MSSPRKRIQFNDDKNIFCNVFLDKVLAFVEFSSITDNMAKAGLLEM